MNTRCLVLTIVFWMGGLAAGAQEFVPGMSPFGMPPPGMPPAGTAPEPFLPATAGPPQPSVSYGGPPIRPAVTERLLESTWYARVDYFHWNERVDGQDFVTEQGPLMTLGYVRRNGPERFRAELFGASIGYDGGVQYEDGSSEPLSSHTNYMGVRGEYDLIYDPDWWESASLFVGVGSRFWFRDLPDDVTASGTYVFGYRETWWTIYPYIGLEKRHSPYSGGIEWYASGRIGSTAITSERVSWEDVTLYPKAGLAGQCEIGLRGPHLFLSAFFEGMAWRDSSVVRNIMQPRSQMLTVGLRTGFSF